LKRSRATSSVITTTYLHGNLHPRASPKPSLGWLIVQRKALQGFGKRPVTERSIAVAQPLGFEALWLCDRLRDLIAQMY